MAPNPFCVSPAVRRTMPLVPRNIIGLFIEQAFLKRFILNLLAFFAGKLRADGRGERDVVGIVSTFRSSSTDAASLIRGGGSQLL